VKIIKRGLDGAGGGASSSSESSFHDKREIQIGAVPTADFEMGSIQFNEHIKKSASMRGRRRML
jgi:hypothetical protein